MSQLNLDQNISQKFVLRNNIDFIYCSCKLFNTNRLFNIILSYILGAPSFDMELNS